MTAEQVTQVAGELVAEAETILQSFPGDTYSTDLRRAGAYLLEHPSPSDPVSRRLRDSMGWLVVRDMYTAGVSARYERMMELALQLAGDD